jgi:mRNA interferase MazF
VIRRGEIYWCDLEPKRGHEQGKVRPVMVISADLYNQSRSPLAAVIPLTRASVKHPLHVEMTGSECGLKEDSTALVDHLKFVDRERLSERAIGRAGAGTLARIDRNLMRVLGLNAEQGIE